MYLSGTCPRILLNIQNKVVFTPFQKPCVIPSTLEGEADPAPEFKLVVLLLKLFKRGERYQKVIQTHKQKTKRQWYDKQSKHYQQKKNSDY